MAGLGKLDLIALLAEYLLFLKDERGAVQLFVTAAAGEVLRVPHTTHSTGKWTTGEGRQ